MNLQSCAAFFEAARQYRDSRHAGYRRLYAVEFVAAAAEITVDFGKEAKRAIGKHVDLVQAASRLTEEQRARMNQIIEEVARDAADAICDAVYPPPPPVVEESPLACAAASMRGEHPLSSNVSHDHDKACDECGEFHALSASCVPYDTCPECRATTGHHKLDCGKRERVAPISMTLVDEAVAPCADPAAEKPALRLPPPLEIDPAF